MGGGRAAGREVWVRVEDGRGGDGKLVLLARPGLSNAVGGRGNVGIAPARQGQSAIHPAAVKVRNRRNLLESKSTVGTDDRNHLSELFRINTLEQRLALSVYVATFSPCRCTTEYTYICREDFRDERQIRVS
jgi:hypothetical protein